MSERQAFLQAILDAPTDDAPRLVFADWLDEHGGDDDRMQAEFIRTQIALVRLPAEDDRRAELTARERQLSMSHGLRWAGGVRCGRFERGFLERLQFWGPDEFVEQA